MSTDLIQLVHKLGRPRMLLIGDIMLDRYVWGDADRISQEAPVILLRADKREERLGGAASVATMLRALGADVVLAGVVGADADGERTRELLREWHVDHSAVLVDPGRPSTVKERYIGRAHHRHPQQMLRVDYEVRDLINESLEQRFSRVLAERLPECDIVLISDYNKGVCAPGLLSQVISSARTMDKRVLVDPIRGGDYAKYKGASALTPNRLEASLATGIEIETIAEARTAGRRLRDSMDAEAAIITLDKQGMMLVHADGREKLIPTRPRQVYDVTGAGDMVLSTLGVALAADADYEAAIALANVAGGLEVEKIGVVTVTRDEILQDILDHETSQQDSNSLGKIMTLEKLTTDLEKRRLLGHKIAFTNGCFDILHVGHVEYLQDARSRANALVVGLNSDASIRRLKGPDRPINSVEARATVLAAQHSVDYVVVFDDDTPSRLIEAVKPDVLVKGADYKKQNVVGAQFVESYGGEVYLAPLRPGYSTTGIVEKLRGESAKEKFS
ncbi:MAG: D-glycero-beta-D-manno-heptose 1-phosphate adenylyltransferase [Gemmataceae bacterium]